MANIEAYLDHSDVEEQPPEDVVEKVLPDIIEDYSENYRVRNGRKGGLAPRPTAYTLTADMVINPLPEPKRGWNSGKPIKVTDHQMGEIIGRRLRGERLKDLAKEFDISVTTLSAKISKISKVATDGLVQVIEGESKLSALPATVRGDAYSILSELRSMSTHLISAGAIGAKNAHSLQKMARIRVKELEENKRGVLDRQKLSEVAVITSVANDSAKIALDMVKNSQVAERVVQQEQQVLQQDTKTIDPIEASRAYQQLLG